MKKIAVLLFITLSAGLLMAGPVDQQFDDILGHYFRIQQALSRDTSEGIEGPAASIARLAGAVNSNDPEVAALMKELAESAKGLQGKELEAARDQFFLVSKPLLVYLNQHYTGQNEYFRYYCSMAKKAWVQDEKAVRNPYHGSEMLTCGELIR